MLVVKRGVYEVQPVYERDRIQDKMIVVCPCVAVCCNNNLKAFAPTVPSQLNANGMCGSSIDLTGLEALVTVEALPAIEFVPDLFGAHEVLCCTVHTGTVDHSKTSPRKSHFEEAAL